MTEFRAAVGTDLPQQFATDSPPVLVGVSAAMDRLRDDVLRTAAQDGPVLISGEAGTGKSLVARALHQHGPRASQLCAVVPCQAFPETLLEIELFGCTKGSVAGATSDRQGVIELASGGTVILENVDAISDRTHARLERFLASGRVHSVGTRGPGTSVNTRIVATRVQTPSDDEESSHDHASGWSRLGTGLPVPSLRDRQSDIPTLTQFFASFAGAEERGVMFSSDAMHALSSYSWPGNVRQLRSVVQRLVEWAGPGEIQPTDLPVGIRPRAARGTPERRPSVGEELFARVQASGESFWASVYPLFMKREITRTDLRDLIRRALGVAHGDADSLVRVLNMPGSDRQKFVRFLRKYNCELTS